MTRSRQSHKIRRLVVEDGLTCSEVAERFGISPQRANVIVTQFHPEGVKEARKRYQNRHRPEVDKEA